jgi:hypothetical protein
MENNINVPDNSLVERQVRGGANWFFWIVGFSIVNVICIFLNYDFSFTFGLDFTSKFALIARFYHASITGFIAIVAMVFIFAAFVLIGHYGRKFKPWAFLAGMIIYFADAILLALGRDWWGAGFHALALIFIVFSFVALIKYRKIVIEKSNHYKV